MSDFNVTCKNISCNEELDLSYNCLQICVSIWLHEITASPMSKIHNWLTYYSSSYLVLPAIFFNLLSLVVLSNYAKRNISSTTINCFMKYLCIVDMLTIFSKFINEIVVVRNVHRIPQYKINSIICKMTPFFESVFGITSIYILILMSFDKLICVVFPLKSGSLLVPKKAKIKCSFLIFFSAIYSSHNIFNQTVYIQNSTTTYSYSCYEKNESIKNHFELIDNIIRVFIPIILLCFCNATIICFYVRAGKKTVIVARSSSADSLSVSSNILRKPSQVSKFHVNSPQEENLLNIPHIARIIKDRNSQGSISEDFSSTLNKSFVSLKSTCLTDINKKKNFKIRAHNSKIDKSSNYMTAILLTVSFGFIALNLPYAIYAIHYSKILPSLHSEKLNKKNLWLLARYEFFGYTTHFLLDLNYLANFFFYFLSGSKFRKRLYSIFSFKKIIQFFRCNKK
jgi:hypothetical protein